MPLFQAPDRGDPRVRMFLLLCMLFALIGLMVYFGNLTEAYYSHYPSPNAQVMTHADGDPYRSIEPADSIAPITFELAEFAEANPQLGAEIEMQTDGLLALYKWLAGQTQEDMAAKARGRNRWHVSKMIREPSAWRGQVVHVYGMLADVERVEFHQNPPGLQHLYLLRLYDQHEMEFFSVLTPEMPEGAKVFEDKEEDRWEQWGDTLACDAVFLMNLPYRRDRRIRTTPLFVTKRVYLSLQGRAPPVILDERDHPTREYVDIEPERTVPALDMDFIRDKLFAPPKDGGAWQFLGTDFRREASNLREEKLVFDHAFEYLWGQDSETIRRGARNPEINHRTIMADNEPPAWMTGQLTRVRGLVATVEPMRFSPEQPGLERIYLLTIQDTSFRQPADHTWTVAVPNLPEGLKWGDTVEANGVFLKIHPYRTRLEQWRWAPLVAARSVEILPTPSTPLLPSYMTRKQIYILGTAFGAVVFGIFFLMYRASQKDTEKLKAIRHRSQEARVAAQRRQLQLAKLAKQNAHATPTPPPPPATPTPGAPLSMDAPSSAQPGVPDAPPPAPDGTSAPPHVPAADATTAPAPEPQPYTPEAAHDDPPMPDVSAPGFMAQLVHRAVHQPHSGEDHQPGDGDA